MHFRLRLMRRNKFHSFIYKFCVISYGYFLYLNPFFRCRRRRWSTLLPKYTALIRLRRSGLRSRCTATRCIGAMFNSSRLVFVDLVLHDRGADVVNVGYIGLCRLIAMLGGWQRQLLLWRWLMQLVLLELMICNQFAGIATPCLGNGTGWMGRRIGGWIEQKGIGAGILNGWFAFLIHVHTTAHTIRIRVGTVR